MTLRALAFASLLTAICGAEAIGSGSAVHALRASRLHQPLQGVLHTQYRGRALTAMTMVLNNLNTTVLIGDALDDVIKCVESA